MLQFKTQPTDTYSVPEQCQMVIEGGCQWIQLSCADADDATIRELAAELIPLCRESDTILMLENHPDLAKELGLHGIHITLGSGLNAASVREDFGPEAIIGIEVTDAASITALKGADIDYVSLPATISHADRAAIVALAAQGGNEMPVVFEGDYTVDNVTDALRHGASGVCTGSAIVTADDPVSYTTQMIDTLSKR